MSLNLTEIIFIGVMVGILLIIILLSIGKNGNFNLIVKELSRFSNKTELQIELNKNMILIASLSKNVFNIGLFGTILAVAMALKIYNPDNIDLMMSQTGMALMSTAGSVLVNFFGNSLSDFLNGRIDEILLK